MSPTTDICESNFQMSLHIRLRLEYLAGVCVNRIVAKCTRMQRHSKISSSFFILDFFLPSCFLLSQPFLSNQASHQQTQTINSNQPSTPRTQEENTRTRKKGNASTLPLLSRLLPLLAFRPLPIKYFIKIKYTKSPLHHLYTKEPSLHPRQLKHSPRLQPLHKRPLPLHKNRTRPHEGLESSFLYPDP